MENPMIMIMIMEYMKDRTFEEIERKEITVISFDAMLMLRIFARTNIGDRPSLRKRLGGSTVMILTVCVNGQRLVLESTTGCVINYFFA